MAEKKNCRSEKSLSTLTKKFVELLQQQPTVDLNIVSNKKENIKNAINF